MIGNFGSDAVTFDTLIEATRGGVERKISVLLAGRLPLEKKERGAVNVILIVVCLAVAGAAFAVLSAWYQARHRSDLGSMSPQWVAHQSAGNRPDPNR